MAIGHLLTEFEHFRLDSSPSIRYSKASYIRVGRVSILLPGACV